MNKIYTFFAGIVLFLGVVSVSAQPTAPSFTVQHDTMTIVTSGPCSLVDAINNTTSSGITMQWKVYSTNFPSDWIPLMGFCDNSNCFTGTALWPSGSVNQSVYPSGLGDFHFTTDLSTVTTTGTYWVRVRFNNMYAASDTAYETFIITKVPTSVPVVKSMDEVLLYPNPATADINVVYDANADIKTIAVYNIIGKQMNLFRTTDNSGANLHLDNLSSGVYFVRLVNSHGDVVATRKFTKQ